MAALPYIQLYVADYLADTAHLNAAQHGAYMLLIMNYWQRGKPLKNCNERLANVARMSSEEWSKSRTTLEEFFTITEEEWIHKRIEADLEAVRSKSDQKRVAGMASAEQRRNKRSTNAKQALNGNATEDQQVLIYTETDVDTEEDKKEKINKKEKVGALPPQTQKTLSSDLPDSNGVMALPSPATTPEIKKINARKKSTFSRYKPELQEIFTHWQQVMGHPGALLDDKRQQKIIRVLELGFDVKKLKQAIDGCKCSKFHMGENENSTVYDELNVIFRDAAQIEKFIRLAAKSHQSKGAISGHLFETSPEAKRIVEQYEREALRCTPPV